MLIRAQTLRHPNVVPMLGVVWSLPSLQPSMPVLVRECHELGTLSNVSSDKPWDVAQNIEKLSPSLCP